MLALAAAAPLLLAGCFSDGRANDRDGEATHRQTIRTDDDVRSVRTLIRMRAGELHVSGGAGDLMDGAFEVKNRAAEPEVVYRRSGDEGRLEIRQPAGEKLVFGNDSKNVWTIRLNEQTPMDLDVEMPAGTADLRLGTLNLNDVELSIGAGECDLDLRGTPARRLEVNAGVGSVRVDLSGAWNHGFDAEINGGVGEVTLVLPQKTGVRVDVAGLGSVRAEGFVKEGGTYRNATYDQTEHTLRVEISGGLGSVALRLAEDGS